RCPDRKYGTPALLPLIREPAMKKQIRSSPSTGQCLINPSSSAKEKFNAVVQCSGRCTANWKPARSNLKWAVGQTAGSLERKGYPVGPPRDGLASCVRLRPENSVINEFCKQRSGRKSVGR